MKALVKLSHAPEDAELRQVEEPRAGEGEVVVKLHAAGVCGTDLKLYKGLYHSYKTPLILGHELCGTIAESTVPELRPGMRVVSRTIVESCGKCRACLAGRESLCPAKKRIGFDVDGAFAEYIKLAAHQIHVLPDGVSLDLAVLTEPLTVVVHALKPISIHPSERVLIIGPGPIGLLALLICKANGAAVAVVGRRQDAKRLELARTMGADQTLFSEDERVMEDIRAFSGGQGPDVVLECSGSAAGVTMGLRAVRPAGTYVQIGTSSREVTADFMQIAYKEIRVYGSIGHNRRDWDDSLRLLASGLLDLRPFLGNDYALEEWKAALDASLSGEVLKAVFKFS